MAAHRYWRVKYDTNGANGGRQCCNTFNVEMRTAKGGADVTNGGTGIASSECFGGSAAGAFDNDGGSYWHDCCGDATAAWIGYDFGAGNEKAIVEFTFEARHDGYAGDDSIRTGGLEWSDDGAAWTRAFSIPEQPGWNNSEVRVFSAPPPAYADDGGHRYWRVRMTQHSGQGFDGISRIGFFRQGVLESYYGVPAALSNTQAGSAVDVAGASNDTDKIIQWYSGEETQGIRYDFGAGHEPKIDSFRIAPNRDASNRTWKQMALEWSDDNFNWTESFTTDADLDWSSGAAKVFAAPFGTPHSYWRVRSLWHGGQIGMNELEMAAFSGGPNQCSGGTPLTDTTYGGYYGADKAFNGNYTSGPGEWAGSYNAGYLGYQFAAPTRVNEMRIVTFSDASLTPNIMLVESSDDGAAWTAEWLIVGQGMAYSSTTPISCPRPDPDGAHRWWGILNFEGNGGGGYRDAVIAEFEMHGVEAGPDLTGSGTAFATPINGSYPASQAFDDNPATITYTGQTSPGSLMAYDFGSAVTIAEMAITRTGGSNSNRAPGQGWAVNSTDGVNYALVSTYDSLDYSTETATFAVESSGPPAGPAIRRRAIIVT